MKNFLAILLLVSPILANANITLTSNRMVFDANERAEALQFRNTSSMPISFTTDFSLNEMTEHGVIQKVETSDKSAIPMIRFSPKRGVIAPGEKQVIRFAVRRPANMEDGEYRAVLNLMTTIATDKPESVTLNSTLAYNMPIIVRKGRLDATTDIEQARLIMVNNAPHIELWQKLDGNRSLFGNFVVTDSDNNEVGSINGIATYPPLTRRKVIIPLNNQVEPGTYKIQYQEVAKFGGNLSASTVINL